MSSDEKETTFYSDDRGVRVTNARLVVGQTTYAMGNVTSVSTRTNYLWTIVVLVVGLILVVVGLASGTGPQRGGFGLLGALLLLVGALAVARPARHLRISTSAGEVSALSSRKKEYVESVAHAIQEAMIHRG